MRQQASRKILILLSCLLAEVGLFGAEPYMFERIQVEDGLSQNMVYSIFQDEKDFIWLGTQSGLDRYDGGSFRIFTTEGHNGLGNDGILSVSAGPDGKIWVGTIDGLSLFDPRRENFTAFPVRDEDGHLIQGMVHTVTGDRSGNFWASVTDTCLVKFAPDLTYELMSPFCDVPGARIRSMYADADGSIWVASYVSGLLRIREDGQSARYSYDGDDMFTKVVRLDGEHLLVGTMNRGVLKFSRKTHIFTQFEGFDASSAHFVHDILCDSKGRIWVGCENGLLVRETSGKITHLTHTPNNPYSISDNAVFSLCEDNEGGIWVGTYFGGVNYYSEYSSQFRKYLPLPGENGLKGKNISEFLEDSKGNVWFGTEDAGLHMMNPATGEISNGYLPATNVHSLLEDSGKLWVGTYNEGLFILDIRSKRYQNVRPAGISGSALDNNIYSLMHDSAGNIWLGTDNGLFIHEARSGKFIKFSAERISSQVNDLWQDEDGAIWIATIGQGLFKCNPDRTLSSISGHPQFITCILEDRNHDFWMGTDGSGILHYSRGSGTLEIRHDISRSLPAKTIYKLLEDNSGNIWGSTSHGLFRLSPEDGEIITFDNKSGLVCDQYNFKSGMKSTSGEFFFGGVKGFVSFLPDELTWPRRESRLVFNRFLLYNEEVVPGAKDSPLEQSISYAEEIRLKPDQSVFSIGFADLNYPLAGVGSYQYRMSGLDDNWINLDKAGIVTFSDLNPGNYRLEVRSIGSVDDTCGIGIHVLPPWYRTLLAKILYALLIISVVIAIVQASTWKMRKDNEKVIWEMERRKEKELYDAKIGFFTHITHEIRTPLTLITAPIADIMEKAPKDSPIYEDLSIVQRNSSRLLSLVNELLDFRKAGVETMLPNFIHTDIVALTAETMSSFKILCENRGLEVETEFPPVLEADVDKEIYIKITSNIMGNACKHAATRIHLKLESDGHQLRLSVSNDGPGIPEAEAEHIFDPFVKLDENIPGSGIGLAFARTLTETHGGRIYLDTAEADTCFCLELPLVHENTVHFRSDESDEALALAEEGGQRSRILVVDDNEDFRSFLSRKLSAKYDVLTAANGLEAKEILSKELIDLVITDLMMPGMDGMSLCASIKEDINSSHIPVILITAKTDPDTKIESVSQGADDFIPKPFQMSYLAVKVENLLKARENIRQAISSNPDLEIASMATSRKDAEFLSRLTAAIEEKMENPELGVDDLADSMNMSRATLYRKMKGVTQFSPNEFIRLCRLKKAAALLSAKELPVNDIAYLVGFSSSSYFSRCFSKQFGVSPKDYPPQK